MSDEDMFSGFKRHPVNPSSNTSTIILVIFGHGMDLCSVELPEKKQNTLMFSMANKGCVNIELDIVKKIDYLVSEIQNEKQIFNVIEDFDKKCSSDEEFDLHKDLITYKDNKDFLYDYLMNVKTKQKEKYEKANDKYALKFIEKNIDTFKTERENEKKKISNIIESCEKGYTGKPRYIQNDRLYDISNEVKTDPFDLKSVLLGKDNFKYNGVYLLGIRRPKTEEQNKYSEIYERLNEKKRFSLSEILHMCYNEYNFDYVTIIDFACRCNEDGTCNIDCPSSIDELKEGQEVMKIYKEKNLGGKKKRRQTKRNEQKKRKTKRKRR